MEIQQVSFYWNSMSEMFVPTSVWDQSFNNTYGVFELIDADMLHDMMKDIFAQKVGMQNSYILDPMTLRI